MASKPKNTKGKNTGSSNRKTSGSKNSNAGKNSQMVSFQNEVILLVILAVCIILFISNFGFGGFVGEAVSSFCFGLFGIIAYLFPISFFVGAAFLVSNRDNWVAFVKIVAGVLLVMFLCLLMELLTGSPSGSGMGDSFAYASEHKMGGGAVGGILASLFCPAIGRIGTYVVTVIALIIAVVLITERSFLAGVKHGSRKVYDNAREDAARRREVKESRREERMQRRIDRKVEGVALDTKIAPDALTYSDNISELKIPKEIETVHRTMEMPAMSSALQVQESISEPVVVEKVHRKQKPKKKDNFNSMTPFEMDTASESPVPFEMDTASESLVPFQMDDTSDTMPMEADNIVPFDTTESIASYEEDDMASFDEDNIQEAIASFDVDNIPESIVSLDVDKILASMEPSEMENTPESMEQFEMDGVLEPENSFEPESFNDSETAFVPAKRKYVFPPISLLEKGNNDGGESKNYLQETALKLQQILKNFGVNVTITDVSCGPSVTRYELQPEMGVKVSKIVNLTDDIKLNLAATDIRIEAPIPGKAAIGIEVPNKEKVMVRFRDMIESPDFQKHKSNICFTAGKDIGGQVVVADIAKMPHMLIAGATGSGKSVCINTIIMSILYKADPDDVKLILIDPKVVELSVYNGIPHLLIPVVTDPKKAAGALHWAVAEMDDRYKKFAEYQVRDLKGYNQKVAAIADVDDETKPQKMPQIIVIVDELADLMMVAPGDVEEAICRLAQLARAAGIHLIIATQRPSVDVITGLIKANMPSRIAFSVSSGVDSRTILDMVGAEKLLGNGDMLFYPQGIPKPQRVQGPFVSDSEVEAVVDFLRKQSTVVYSEEIEEKMNNVSIGASPSSGGGSAESYDAYFVEAGKFVIEKDKGSIGMLQRVFRIGFNRAARIMDQLEEAGVVGAEEGTKPRKILMSMEEFETYVEESV